MKVTERFPGTVTNVRLIGPLLTVGSIFGVSSAEDFGKVSEAIAKAYADKNFTDFGAPNICEVAPLLACIRFSESDIEKGAQAFNEGRVYSPNGELLYAVTREDIIGLIGDDEANALFEEEHTNVCAHAYEDPDAVHMINHALNNAVQVICGHAAGAMSAYEIGAIATDENGHYITGPDGLPLADNEKVESHNAEGKAKSEAILKHLETIRESRREQAGRDYEEAEHKDGGEKTTDASAEDNKG